MSWLIFLKTILMGVIEGITEFLPVSSTGHMILAEEFIQLSEEPAFTSTFTVFIQSGAILAVAVLFWKDLWPFSSAQAIRRAKCMLWIKIFAAFLPAAAIGLIGHRFIEEYLFNPLTVACALIVYGILLILFEKHHRLRPDDLRSIHDLSFRTAFLIGLAQCLAIIPGTSRSTATILGGMLLGLPRTLAAEFSFFLSIPTIAGAGLLQLLQTGAVFSQTEWLILATGFAVSFGVAAAVIKWLMRYLRKHSFMPFGWYRIVLGITVLIWWIFR